MDPDSTLTVRALHSALNRLVNSPEVFLAPELTGEDTIEIPPRLEHYDTSGNRNASGVEDHLVHCSLLSKRVLPLKLKGNFCPLRRNLAKADIYISY